MYPKTCIKCIPKPVLNVSQNLFKTFISTSETIQGIPVNILAKSFLNKFILFLEKSRCEKVLGLEVRFVDFRVGKVMKWSEKSEIRNTRRG